MLEFENTVYIDRPIGEVFAFLSDFEISCRKVRQVPGSFRPWRPTH
jgi:carbon monoxide dehydrogenase subunit G